MDTRFNIQDMMHRAKYFDELYAEIKQKIDQHIDKIEYSAIDLDIVSISDAGYHCEHRMEFDRKIKLLNDSYNARINVIFGALIHVFFSDYDTVHHRKLFDIFVR